MHGWTERLVSAPPGVAARKPVPAPCIIHNKRLSKFCLELLSLVARCPHKHEFAGVGTIPTAWSPARRQGSSSNVARTGALNCSSNGSALSSATCSRYPSFPVGPELVGLPLTLSSMQFTSISGNCSATVGALFARFSSRTTLGHSFAARFSFAKLKPKRSGWIVFRRRSAGDARGSRSSPCSPDEQTTGMSTHQER